MWQVKFRWERPIVPKARPRMTKSGHVFMPKNYTECKKALSLAMQASLFCDDGDIIPSQKPFNLVVSFPKKTRGDIDNLVGTILDSLQGSKIVRNDSQCIYLCANKEDFGDAYTAIFIKSVEF